MIIVCSQKQPLVLAEGPGVYVTLNPVRPDLLARAVNRVIRFAKHTTRRLRHSVAPMVCSLTLIRFVHPAFLPPMVSARLLWIECGGVRIGCEQGWPDPVRADSGNGGHLLYRIDIANDTASTELVKGCLQALGLLFADDQVVVDPSTYNASRIWKVYGTLAARGR